MTKLDKRADIMRAALELIAEQGFHGAPMSEISEKAGVATGTIYRYFENKEVLINELHQELEKKIIEHIQEGYPVEQPLRERFLFLLRELLRYFIKILFIFVIWSSISTPRTVSPCTGKGL